MTMNEKIYAESGFGVFGVGILPADGYKGGSPDVVKTLLAAPVEGYIVKAINLTSNDTVARYFELSLYDGANTFVLGTVAVAISSGQSSTGNVASVNVLDSTLLKGLERDISGNSVIKLPSGWELRGRMIASAISSGKQIDITVFYASLAAL